MSDHLPSSRSSLSNWDEKLWHVQRVLDISSTAQEFALLIYHCGQCHQVSQVWLLMPWFTQNFMVSCPGSINPLNSVLRRNRNDLSSNPSQTYLSSSKLLQHIFCRSWQMLKIACIAAKPVWLHLHLCHTPLSYLPLVPGRERNNKDMSDLVRSN